MTELEILQRRVEILEKGFQEIIALINFIKKGNEGKKNKDTKNTQVCFHCGKVFLLTSKHRRRTCSNSCRYMAWRKKKKGRD